MSDGEIKKKYPRSRHPNSLAALRPWPKGVSGNPRGRPRAGASVADYRNILADKTQAELKAVHDDPKAPQTKRIAAAQLIVAGKTGERLLL